MGNVSQEQSTEAQRAEARTQDTRAFVRRVRALTRRKYTPEEKIRIGQELLGRRDVKTTRIQTNVLASKGGLSLSILRGCL